MARLRGQRRARGGPGRALRRDPAVIVAWAARGRRGGHDRAWLTRSKQHPAGRLRRLRELRTLPRWRLFGVA